MLLTNFESYNPEHITEYLSYTIFLRDVFETPNGYVLIKKGQNGYGYERNYGNSLMQCHGGITWNQMIDEGRLIGFDTKHPGDFMPFANGHNIDGHKWTDEEALNECKHIVDQLIEM